MAEVAKDVKVAVFELGTVDEMVTKFNGQLLLDGIQYHIPAIPIFGVACPNPLVNTECVVTHPAIYATEVTDFKVIGGAAFPIIQNKSIVHQNFSVETWETWEQAVHACRIRSESNVIGYAHLTEPYQFEHQVINLIGNGSFNYAHWLTEYLPQIVLLKEAGVDLSNYKILVDVASFPSMLEALTMLGISKEQLMFIGTLALTEFPKALWVSPVANVVFQRPNALLDISKDTLAEPQYAIFHPEVIQATKNTYLKLLDVASLRNVPEKIFIRRTPGRKQNARTVINEGEIQTILESQGFVTVDPSGLSFAEQVALFSNAKFIVSASGAALVNMIWAPAGAKIVVLMNDSKVANYWYFGNLAIASGHQLGYVLGNMVNTGAWDDHNHADFEISPQALVESLQYYGLSTDIDFSLFEPPLMEASEEELQCELDHYWKSVSTTTEAGEQESNQQKAAAMQAAISLMPQLEYAVDIGCGEGLLTQLLANKAMHIDAYDISEKLIGSAVDSASTLNVKNINFVSLPFSEIVFKNRLDLVVCSELTCNVLSDQVFSRLVNSIKQSLIINGYWLVIDTFSLQEDRLLRGSSSRVSKIRNLEMFKLLMQKLGFTIEFQKVITENYAANTRLALFLFRNGA